MAVRDDQQPGTGEQGSRSLPWRDTLGHAPAALLIGGLLMYAFLSFCYARFYGSLGIDPNDVGLSYTGTLTRASGLVFGFVVVLAVYLIAQLPILSSHWPKRLDRWAWRHPRPMRVLGLTALSLLSSGLAFSVAGADIAADQVRAGKAVSPPRLGIAPIRGFEVLAIHADPATVEPVGKPDDSPAAERLRGRRLLYLGQSGGTVVLYDAAVQRAVYVPASSIVLHVANCDAKPLPDPACQHTCCDRPDGSTPALLPLIVGALLLPVVMVPLGRLRRRRGTG
jgi:hypothetical protein